MEGCGLGLGLGLVGNDFLKIFVLGREKFVNRIFLTGGTSRGAGMKLCALRLIFYIPFLICWFRICIFKFNKYLFM
jgi:hypothetical protein